MQTVYYEASGVITGNGKLAGFECTKLSTEQSASLDTLLISSKQITVSTHPDFKEIKVYLLGKVTYARIVSGKLPNKLYLTAENLEPLLGTLKFNLF